MQNSTTSDLKKNIEILKNGTADDKLDLLNNLNFSEPFHKEYVEPIANLIADEEKGVRNSATMFILGNQDPGFPYYVVPFVKSKNISIRNLAGEILIKLGSNSVDAIVKFDHENDDDNLKFVVDVLGLIGDQAAAPFTMGVLSDSENDNVILACIEGLGNLKYEPSVEILMLFYDRNELYKPTTVEALGKIGSKAALDFLISRFESEDELTKYSILESLGNLGDIETFFFLLEQVNTVSGPLVIPLITSISTLKDRFNLDIPFDNRMKSLLMYTITEGTIENKRIAFNLIDSFDDKDILHTSLNILGEDFELDEMIKDKIFRNADYIYHEIHKIIKPQLANLRQILNLFLQTVGYVNEYQIPLTISIMEVRNIVHSLSGLLNHHDEEVRRLGMEILFSLDVESALLLIDSMVVDENMWNRLRLVELLERVPQQIPEPVLKKLTEDEDEMVKERAEFLYNSRANNLSDSVN